MRELLKKCTLLEEFDVKVLQLVEMGLCTYGDVKNGVLNFRDIIKLIEYVNIKNTYLSIKQQQEQNDRKARELWQK